MSGCQNDWSGKMSRLQNVWVSKCLGVKMSGCQNVFICMQWHNVWVAQCLGGEMSCCQNVSVPKYLVVIMSGCQKGGCQNILVSKCPGVKMSGAKMSENRKIQ